MSTGGVFQLIINQGSQDKLLMATQLLNQRLKEIHRLRCKNPAISDPTPTLIDIERTHVLYINAHFKPFVAIGYEYQLNGVSIGIADFGQDLVYSIPQFGDFFNDMVVHFQLTGLTAGSPDDQVYYTDMLGHRLVQGVKFDVNGNFLDQYDSNTYNFHYNFFVPSSKKKAWLRAIGQEVPSYAYLTNNQGVDEYREVKAMVNGNQTPKYQHAVVDVWLPLLFWFNGDPRLSIPSVAVPYGQRFIHVLTAPASTICASVSGASFTLPTMTIADLYINNIFVNPDVHDIFIKRIGFSLIRVHMTQITQESSNTDQVQLSQLKFPIETIYLGLQPTINITGVDNMTDWWRYSNVVTQNIPYPVAIPSGVPSPPYTLAFSNAVWKYQTPTISTLQVINHGILLYDAWPFELYADYIPYTYGATSIAAPEDPGVCMITFNLYPGTYQPSGHFNFSQARETYLNFTSASVSSSNPAQLIIVGVAINFLLVAEATLVLRFNT